MNAKLYIFFVFICFSATSLAQERTSTYDYLIQEDLLGKPQQSVQTLTLQAESLLKSLKRALPKNLSDLQGLGQFTNDLINKKMASLGGVDTGGGTLVKVGGQVGLLDLYLYNQEAFYDVTRNPDNIRPSRDFDSTGLGLLNEIQNPLLQKTLAQVKKWQASSPILAGELLRGLVKVPLFYHRVSIDPSPLEYFLPENIHLQASQMKMIALYTKGYGIHIGLNDFQELTEKNQMAVFIHETLRFMNSSSSFGFSNETLQKITAKIMSEPSGHETLDTKEYLGSKFFATAVRKYYFIKSIEFLSVKICNSSDYSAKVFCDPSSQDITFKEYMENFRINKNKLREFCKVCQGKNSTPADYEFEAEMLFNEYVNMAFALEPVDENYAWIRGAIIETVDENYAWLRGASNKARRNSK